MAIDLYGHVRDFNAVKMAQTSQLGDRKAQIADLGFFRENYLYPKVKNLEWYSLADAAIRDYNYVLIIIPPGWGKTMGYTAPYPLSRVCMDRATRGLIISKTQRKGANFLEVIRHNLKFNQKMQNHFGGPFWDKGLKWNEGQIQVIGYDPNEQTPTITITGMTGQMEGNKVHWIVLDDPVDVETAFSEVAKVRFLDTLNLTIRERLVPNGKLIFITHRFELKDIAEELMGASMFQPPYGKTLIIPAVQGEGPPGSEWVPDIEMGHSTCPTLFPDNILFGELKHSLPDYAWYASFLQRPMSRSNSEFVYDWISPENPANTEKWVDVMPKWLDVSVDPAYSDTRKLRNDYTGFVVAGPHPTDPFGDIVFAVQAMRIGSDFTKEYRLVNERYSPRRFFVECTNAKTLPDSLRAAGMNNVVKVDPRRGKEVRIGDLKKCFYSMPHDVMKQGERRLYFHRSLLLESFVKFRDRFRAEILPGWSTFTDEYRVWAYHGAPTHDHILDALAQYIWENYGLRGGMSMDTSYHVSKFR